MSTAINCVVNQDMILDEIYPKIHLSMPLAYDNAFAHAMRITAFDHDKNPADLTGVGVVGNFKRSNDTTVTPILGTVTDNVAEILLPPSCYVVPGRFTFTMNLTQLTDPEGVDEFDATVDYEKGDLVVYDGVVWRFTADHDAGAWTGSDAVMDGITRSAMWVEGHIDKNISENIVDPGTPVGNIEQAIGNATAAATAAQSAATEASQAAAAAEQTVTNFAPAFDAATANAAGDYVTYTDGKLYLLPEGHTVGTSWANTTHTETDFGAEVSDLKSAFDSVTEETGASKNIFDPTSLAEKSGIAYSNGVYSGTASSFGGTYMENAFEEGQRYTIQLKAKKDGASADTNGLVVKLKYTDNSAAVITIPNTTTEYTKFTATSAEGKNVANLFFEYVSGGSNVWNLKEIQIEQGTEATEYVEPSHGTLTAVDTVARSMSADLEEISETVGGLVSDMEELSQSVGDIETDISAITERSTSRNIFDISSLSEKSGITYENGVFTGTASSFGGTYMEGDFEAGKQYTIQLKAQKTGDPAQTNGLVVKLKHTDNTAAVITIPNSTTTYTKFTATSTEGKTVSSLFIEYVSGGSNIWNVKEIQIEQGTEATEYVAPGDGEPTAVDKVARASVGDVQELADTVSNLADEVETVSASVSGLESDVAEITEDVPSKNVFDTTSLSGKTGISYANGVFSGTASNFSGEYMANAFESGKQYTIQLKAQKEGTAASTNGLVVKLKHTDNTAVAITIPNDTTTYAKFTATSAEGKTVSCVVIEYVSGGSNVWDLKEIQIELGTEATEYVSPVSGVTAVDAVARATATANKHDPWYYRFGSDYLRIAYSSMHIDPINTAVHWLVSSDMGFNVLKGDVEITSDGKLVMCHDAGFTFDGNGRITTYDASNNTKIVEMTYAECRSKVYAILPQRYGDYCPVADIDDFLHICKDKGKICFVTIRDTNTEDVVEELADKIHFYGMENSTIINALSTNLLEVVRENPKCDDIAVNFIATNGYPITTANVDSCVSLKKCFLSIWCNDTKSIIDNSATAIAYADEKDVPLLAGCITSMDTWNYLISKGIRGSQISEPIFDYEPKEQRVNISVSNGAASFWHVFGGNRYTGTATLSGTTLTASDICINGSLLQNVIDGIQPIKMNLFHPVIRCFDSDGNNIPCVWSNNAFVLTLNNANDNIYSIIVNV